MISQEKAKAAILQLWDAYKMGWSDLLQFKNERTRFAQHLREEHPHLLEFDCAGGDKYRQFQREQLVESWLIVHEGFYNKG
jgi:hypothetical protein